MTIPNVKHPSSAHCVTLDIYEVHRWSNGQPNHRGYAPYGEESLKDVTLIGPCWALQGFLWNFLLGHVLGIEAIL